MKAAPSQQPSLNELWKKKVPKKLDRKTKVQLTEIPSMKEEEMSALTTPTNAMDADARSSRPPESSRACKLYAIHVESMLTDTRVHAATPDPERPAKRKASISADEGAFATVSAISYN
jgi:hypothetical protein